MRIIRGSSEYEMVSAFLKAEIDSLDYREFLENQLQTIGCTRALIDNANIQCASENKARIACLSYRGFKRNQRLFEKYPDEVRWYKVTISVAELGHMKYLNQPEWVKRSSGTRLVMDGAANVDRNIFTGGVDSQIKNIESKARSGYSFPELILVGESELSDLILVEGHKRATAYVRAKDYLTGEIEVFVGYSEEMNKWAWY